MPTLLRKQRNPDTLFKQSQEKPYQLHKLERNTTVLSFFGNTKSKINNKKIPTETSGSYFFGHCGPKETK
jgi:hypothetical protein